MSGGISDVPLERRSAEGTHSAGRHRSEPKWDPSMSWKSVYCIGYCVMTNDVMSRLAKKSHNLETRSTELVICLGLLSSGYPDWWFD